MNVNKRCQALARRRAPARRAPTRAAPRVAAPAAPLAARSAALSAAPLGIAPRLPQHKQLRESRVQLCTIMRRLAHSRLHAALPLRMPRRAHPALPCCPARSACAPRAARTDLAQVCLQDLRATLAMPATPHLPCVCTAAMRRSAACSPPRVSPACCTCACTSSASLFLLDWQLTAVQMPRPMWVRLRGHVSTRANSQVGGGHASRGEGTRTLPPPSQPRVPSSSLLTSQGSSGRGNFGAPSSPRLAPRPRRRAAEPVLMDHIREQTRPATSPPVQSPRFWQLRAPIEGQCTCSHSDPGRAGSAAISAAPCLSGSPV